MDFLNKSFAQVSELFRSMTPGARLTAGLLLAIVVVSMGYLFRQGASGPDAYLFGGEPLSQGQLDRVEAAIAEAKLNGYEREGNRIRVPAGQKATYLAAVADAGALPPNFNTILENAIDKGSPWESSAAQRERLKIARQQTISEIVRAMPWVEDAVVLYNEQESREAGKLGVSSRVTASVNVQPIVGETLHPRRAKMLQQLVAHAVNMESEDVNVTNLNGGGVYGAGEEITPEIFDNEYYKTKTAFEMQKRESIMNHLRHISGVNVEVSAELNDTEEEVLHTVKPDPKGTTLRETGSKETSKQAVAAGNGRPGPTSNGPNPQSTAQAPEQNMNETTSETTETDNLVGLEDSRVLRTGFTPKEVWATVMIPSAHIGEVWKSRNPDTTTTPKPEDLKLVRDDIVRNIEEIVEPLIRLGANKGQTNYKYVRVVVLDSLPAPAIEPPSMANKAMAWAGRSWSTLAMLGVAMFSLLVLRNMVKAAPPGGAPAAAATPGLTLHTDEQKSASAKDAAEEPADDRPRLRLKKGRSLKDDLAEIVRDDPDAAAEILRSWIGKAG